MTPAARRWAHHIVIGLAGLWVLLIAVAFAMRLTFPLELEWMEDGALHQAQRIQQGKAVYTAPTTEWIPHLYTPLYPMVLAALGTVFPLGFVLGRVVSILAVASVVAGMWRLVGREGKPVAHKMVAIGLFFAGYVFSYRWLDVVRADALFLALTLWGLLLLREAWGNWRRAAMAGVLMALAFWTKQTTAVLIVSSGVAGLIVAPRQMWAYVTAIALVAGGGVLVGNVWTEGWLWTYIYELHQSHAFNHERFRSKTWGMFLHAAPFLVILVTGLIIRFVSPWLGKTQRLSSAANRALEARLLANRGFLFWGVIFAASMLVSALGYSTSWAEANAFIPGVCFGAVWIAVALPNRGPFELVGLGLVAAQMLFSLALEPRYRVVQKRGIGALLDSYRLQDPERTVPSAALRARTRSLREDIEDLNSRVSSGPKKLLALQRPWWPTLAGGEAHAGSMGFNDVPTREQSQLKKTIRGQLRNSQFDAVWFEGEPYRWLRRELARAYVVHRRLSGSARVLPMVGYMSDAGMDTPYKGAQLWLVRPKARVLPAGATIVADFEDGSLRGFSGSRGGFGRRPIRSIHFSHPAVGPIGGEFLLSSGAVAEGIAATGEIISPVFILPRAGGFVEMLAGYGGKAKDVSITIVETDGDRVHRVALESGEFSLQPHRWQVDERWAGVGVQLRLRDQGRRAVVFMDDLWLIPPS